METANRREEAVLGAILGGAIGDAMGHPTEFLNMEEIESRYGVGGVVGFELYRETRGQRFAPYTDDTQMAEQVDSTDFEASPGMRALIENLLSGGDESLRVRVQLRRPVIGFRAPSAPRSARISSAMPPVT